MSFNDKNELAIKLENVSKCFQIYDKPHHRLIQGLFGSKKQYFKEFWALKDISFEIKKGETVGIIGRNGSGKSTLLQLICGTLASTTGNILVNGRVAALLELGAGFNPEFTGRENVYMSATVLGLSKDEIDNKYDDIIAFADIGEFIEQPVKTYSSGMFVRLAFAVNIVSEPDIMIVDEALAVGDISFQAKCMTALTRIQERGATVLFVSHDVNTIKSLCSRGIYLGNGNIKAIGNSPDVAEQYIKVMREEMNAEHLKSVDAALEKNMNIKEITMQPMEKSGMLMKRSDEFDKRVTAFRYGSGGARINYVELLNMDDEPIQSVEFNQEIKIRIYVEAFSEKDVSINFNIRDDKKVNLVGCNFPLVEQNYLKTEIGSQYLAEYTLLLPLQEGIYSLRTQITSPVVGSNDTVIYEDVIDDAVVFQMARWEVARVWSKLHLFPKMKLLRIKN